MTDVLSDKAPKELWASPGMFRTVVLNDDFTRFIDCGEFSQLIVAKEEAVKQAIVHLGNGLVIDEHGDVVE